MSGRCPFPCTNKTEYGYCKTTACLYAPTIRVTSTPRTETPRTNADRIRAMSDEQLAEFHVGQGCPPGVDLFEMCDEGNAIPPVCHKCWLKWLGQEADNGEKLDG